MGTRSNAARIYVNTMVFTIIAGIISLMLLLALVYGGQELASYAFLIVTVEIGLLVIIVVSVVRIYKYEKKQSTEAINGVTNNINVGSCPDYWTLDQTAGKGKVCLNTYTAPDGRMTLRMQGKEATIDLTRFSNKTIKDVCKDVAEQNSPWTDIRATCDTYNNDYATISMAYSGR